MSNRRTNHLKIGSMVVVCSRVLGWEIHDYAAGELPYRLTVFLSVGLRAYGQYATEQERDAIIEILEARV